MFMMNRLKRHERLEWAFQTAEKELGVEKLLGAEDVDIDRPVLYYIFVFFVHCSYHLKGRQSCFIVFEYILQGM